MLTGMGAPAAIPSPSTNVLHLGPLTVHVYGLCYAVAIMAAIVIMRRRWEAQGGSRELVYDAALWGVPAGIIGGRLYFLATTPGDAPDHWWDRWRSGRAAWVLGRDRARRPRRPLAGA